MFRGPWTHQDVFDSIINAKASKWRVPAALVKGVIGRESGFRQVPGPVGERGLMQITEATARGLGHTGHMDLLWDADLNIDLGTRLLSENFRQARGKWDAAISAYNAGWSRSRPNDGKRSPDGRFVNQSYVDDIVDSWQYFNRRPLSVGAAPSVTGKPSDGKPSTAVAGAGIGIGVVAAIIGAIFLLGRTR